jgi:hypothetical protein
MRDRGTTFRSGACGTRADLRSCPGDPDGVCLLFFFPAGQPACYCGSCVLPAAPGGPPGPAVSEGTPRSFRPRHSTAVPYLSCMRGSSSLPRLRDLLATRKTLTPASRHVYSRHDRFSVGRNAGLLSSPPPGKLHQSAPPGGRRPPKRACGCHGKAAQPITGGVHAPEQHDDHEHSESRTVRGAGHQTGQHPPLPRGCPRLHRQPHPGAGPRPGGDAGPGGLRTLHQRTAPRRRPARPRTVRRPGHRDRRAAVQRRRDGVTCLIGTAGRIERL